ncbi:DUF5980 family protein [Streptomyces profundus]|uniref:DUF5980 family protein n=1 Tax=Streptomyces profundus TaxID=2867410 RepID=UPI001D15F120|nr:DUF5980 family protein [Streptomyces sp. MA3_2.13]UED86585.1 hypothetical protein K4G22_22300 [Streptomyces sp. MA3_2.13]
MKLIRRVTGLSLGLVAALSLTLVGATPAAAATWTLEHTPGHPQRVCVAPERGWPNTYFLAPVSGTWDTVITTGLSDLPPGSYSNGGAINPGEGRDGSYIGLVHVSIAPAPAGDYTATLWADDGTETQTVPVMISFQEECY